MTSAYGRPCDTVVGEPGVAIASDDQRHIGEATALSWQDIDLASGRISAGDSKTEAGIRLVDIMPALRDPLSEGVTAHMRRHPFASILFVRGEDPPCVMAQLGAVIGHYSCR